MMLLSYLLHIIYLRILALKKLDLMEKRDDITNPNQNIGTTTQIRDNVGNPRNFIINNPSANGSKVPQ